VRDIEIRIGYLGWTVWVMLFLIVLKLYGVT
jgi:hypothetical protein